MLPFLPNRLLLSAFFLCLGSLFLQGQQAGFSVDVSDGCAPLTVHFTNQSTGNNLQYLWDFGNGNTSSQKNPGAIYSNDGNFSVKLKVWNSSGTDSTTLQGGIRVYAPPQADFSLKTPPSGCAPVNVTFQDNSQSGTNSIVSYLYDFGDGQVSSQQNPSHTYNSTGKYNVSLEVQDSRGCKSVTSKSNFIQVNSAFSLDFKATNPYSCSPPLTTDFKANISGGSPSYSYDWDFGDGQRSTQSDPTHTYTGTGAFNVTLKVTDGSGCLVQLSKNAVNTTVPTAGFKADITSSCSPLVIHLTDASFAPDPNSTFHWELAGIQSSSRDTIITITNPGVYYATWTVSSTGCSDTLHSTIPFTVRAKPEFDFTASDTLICEKIKEISFRSNFPNALSYKWNFGNGLASGNAFPLTTYYDSFKKYTVSLEIQDKNGCVGKKTKVAYIFKQSTFVDIYQDKITHCIPFTGEFKSQGYAMTPILRYEWYVKQDSFPGKVLNYAFKDEGLFNVCARVYDQMGCWADSCFLIEAGKKPRAAFEIDTNEGCSRGLLVHFINHSKDSSVNKPNKFKWDFGEGRLNRFPKNTEENPSVYYHVPPGKYTVKLRASRFACSDSLTKDSLIIVHGPFAQVYEFFDPCNPDTLWAFDSTLGKNKFWWDINNGQEIIHDSSNIVKHFNTFPWILKYYATDTVTGCWDSTDLLGPAVPYFNAYPHHSDARCAPATIHFISFLYGCDSVKYTFSNGFTTSDSTFDITFDTAGTYWRRLVIYKNGCSKTLVDSQEVILRNPVARGKVTQDTFCIPEVIGFIDLSPAAPNIISRKWEVKDLNSFSANKDTTYFRIDQVPYDQRFGTSVTLTLEDDFGCKSNYSTTIYPAKPNPQASITQEISCANVKTRLSISNVGKAGLERLRYQWITPLASSTNDQFLVQLPKRQMSTILLKSRDAYGCESIDSFKVYTPAGKLDPGFSRTDSLSFCPPLLVSFKDTSHFSGEPIVSWHWEFGDSSESFIQNPKKNFIAPGSYTVKLTIKDSLGCESSISLPDAVVIGGPQGSFHFDPPYLCEEGTIYFTSKTDSLTKIEWDFGDGLLGFDSITSHHYKKPGRYIPSLILHRDGCQYSLPSHDTLIIHPRPVALFSTNRGCAGTVGNLNSKSFSQDGPVKQWYWYADSQLIGNKEQIQLRWPKPGNWDITLFIADTFGCLSNTTQTVQISGIELMVNSPDTTVCLGESVHFQLQATSYNDSLKKVYFSIDDQSFQEGNYPNQFLAAQKKGAHHIRFVTVSKLQCSDTTESSGMLFGDTIPPSSPRVNRVTIRNDMAFIAEFNPSSNKDFYRYQLEWTDDTLIGYQSVNLFDTSVSSWVSTALDVRHHPYYFRLIEENACGKKSDSSRSIVHKSIELTAIPDTNQVRLKWNAYEGVPVTQYMVERELNPDSGKFEVLAILSGDRLEYTDSATHCYQPGNYRVRGISGKTTFFSQSDTAKAQPIHVSDLSPKNLNRISVEDDAIILAEWDTLSTNRYPIDSFLLQMSPNGIQYQNTGSWISGLNWNSFPLPVDSQSYYLRLIIRDQCGDTSKPGKESRSILLKVHLDSLEQPLLNWSSYLGWNTPVDHYIIERYENGYYQSIAEVPVTDTAFTDKISPKTGIAKYCYRVTALQLPGTIDVPRQVWSHSNTTCAPVVSWLFVPNAFTPNNDQLNEGFCPMGKYVYAYRMRIFSRWGEELFTTEEFSHPWDGTYKGQTCESGVYMYWVDALGSDGKIYHLSGNLTLLR
ncbi:MAG: PKD domain-containing protein [Bacteroidetes bacterium]|nr:PKD domain-containing protein [Bacteroidota bacterium]